MSERIHKLLLNLIALGIGLGGLFLLQAAFLDDHSNFELFGIPIYSGFITVGLLFSAIIKLAVARGFMKRKGWAFLLVSVSLLITWMYQLVMSIVQLDHGGWAEGSTHVFAFVFVNVLIAYLGRRSMEERFRPHLIVH